MRFSDRAGTGRLPLAAFELAGAPIAALAGLVVLVFVWGAIATTRLVGSVLSVGQTAVGATTAVVALALAALLLTASTWILAAYRRYFAHPERGRNPAVAVAAPATAAGLAVAYGLATYGSLELPWWLFAFAVASVHVVAFRAIALYSASSGAPRSGLVAGVVATVPVTVFAVTSVTEQILERTSGDAAGARRLLAEAYAWPGVPPSTLVLLAAPLLVALLYGPVREDTTEHGPEAIGSVATAAADSIREVVGRLRPTGDSGPHVDQSRPQQPPVSARRSSSRSSGRSTGGGSSAGGSSGSSSSGPGSSGPDSSRSSSRSSGSAAGDGGVERSSASASGSDGPGTGDASGGASGAASPGSGRSSDESTGSSAGAESSSEDASDSTDDQPTDDSPDDEPLVDGAESETQIFTGDFQEYEQENDSVETCPACEEDIPSDGVYNFCPFCAEEL